MKITEIVYEAGYQECIFESVIAPISIHKTLKGAYQAMRNHLENEYSEWYEVRMICGKNQYFAIDKFGEHERWRVRRVPLLD